MDHTYEELRAVALDVLAKREKTRWPPDQYENLMLGVADVLYRREVNSQHRPQPSGGSALLSAADRELLLEVFWGLFREGAITIGMNDSNREFPFFRVSAFGRRILEGQQAYFFHDVSSFTKTIQTEVPKIDSVTMMYLQEGMQAFRSGCILSSTVMLGVATEHTFLLLMEVIDNNPAHTATFAAVGKERTILQKVNKFKHILDQQRKSLPGPVLEDLDTHFAGILSIIRNFRNQSGHPTGKIVDREQAYVLLQLFVPYCRKMYQLMDHFR